MSRKKRRRDPHAHIDRLVAESGAGEVRRERVRDQTERAAASGPTAARWLVPGGVARNAGSAAGRVGEGAPVDVVAQLLALDPRTTLQGRGGDALRGIAAVVETLVSAGATTIGGVPLVDILVEDEAERQALSPSWDLDALLGGGVEGPSPVDRTIRLAGAMMIAAGSHRSGSRDLAADVGIPGTPRHQLATEVETIAAVAVTDLALPVVVDPAVVVHASGWVGVSYFELFLAAARGLLAGSGADLGGAVLASWFATFGRAGSWELVLLDRVQVDAAGLLQQAASRAGSDHPDVVGSVLVELIRLRHPL